MRILYSLPHATDRLSTGRAGHLARAVALLDELSRLGHEVRRVEAAAAQGSTAAAGTYHGVASSPYADAKGVAQDFAEAARWYRMAAERGNAWAQYSLGGLSQGGKGVPVNDIEAYLWLSLAASQLPPGKSRADAMSERDDLFSEMTSAGQAEALLLVQRWKPKGG